MRWVSGIAGIFLLAGMLLSYLYEDEVKVYAIQHINTLLDTELQVSDIELSLLEKFPYASLHFSDVLIKDAFRDTTLPKDTLIYAKHLYLQFNLRDLFRDDYQVKRVSIEEGTLNLRIAEDGSDNYHFWKQKEDTTEGAFAFALQNVLLSDTRIRYLNRATRQDYAFTGGDLELTGDFTASAFTLTGKMHSRVDHFTAGNVYYLKDTEVDLDLKLNVDTREKRYHIADGSLFVKDLTFLMDGSIAIREDGTDCDLHISGNNLNMKKLISAVPQVYQNKIARYNCRGDLAFNAAIEGWATTTQTPSVTAEFSLTNGDITEKSTGIRLTRLSSEGTYRNSETKGGEKLRISRLQGHLGQGTISGTLDVKDLSDPTISTTLKGSLSLEEVYDFFQPDTFVAMGGKVEIEARFKGKPTHFKGFTSGDFKRCKARGTVRFNNARFRIKGRRNAFEKVNGTLVLRHNDAALKDLTVLIKDSDLKLNGTFKNFLAWLFLDRQMLELEAKVVSNHINLTELLGKDLPETGSSQERYELAFSPFLHGKVHTSIGALQFGKFSAENLRGVITYQHQVLKVENMHLETMEGRFSLNGSVDGTQSGSFTTRCKGILKHIDVQQMFYQLNHFGQTFLQAKHLKGRANATASLALVFDPQFHIDPSSVVSNIDLQIANGELVGLETFQHLADYMKKNAITRKLVQVDELEKQIRHIRFSALQNTIEISNRNVFIPKMHIASNAIDMNIAGKHSFDHEMDYRFDFLLDEVMVKKKPDESFGTIAREGPGMRLFLALKGTANNYKVSLDGEGMKEKFRSDMNREKKEIKSILKDEFGLFKNDTGLPSVPSNSKPAPEFIIEWETPENSATSDTSSTPMRKVEKEHPLRLGKKNKNPTLKKWLDKLGEDQQTTPDVQIEDDW